MIDLELRHLGKRYGEFAAVADISLQVHKGELLSLLGPSGCGKTTVLRLITGFLRPDQGDVVIRGRVVNRVPPHGRDCGMVYQNYALFPHMSVFDNVAFGLKMRRVGGRERARRVREALELVQLAGLERRYPSQLSGGQQQRVALARALVIRPSLLLLDEPLSNLDAKLRLSVREEIRELQQRLGITTVFVTHDQEEALHISDRIAVMCAGRVEQLGSPREIYERPESPFAMEFVGAINRLAGVVERSEAGHLVVRLADGQRIWADRRPDIQPGDALTLGVRPERIALVGEADAPREAVNACRGVIERVSYLGPTTQYRVRLSQQPDSLVVTVRRPSAEVEALALVAGAAVYVHWPSSACLSLLPAGQVAKTAEQPAARSVG